MFLPKQNKLYFIGIDPGTKTGFAVWSKNNKCFLRIETLKIHEAFNLIDKWINKLQHNPNEYFIRIEDARQRTWFGDADSRMERSGAGIREGIGSIKRDCKIWEDFLIDMKIDFEMIKPKPKSTKWKEGYFKKVTGWDKRTSNHARDAAILVFNF